MSNILRIESINAGGMTLAEFKTALEKAEKFGISDDDIVRVNTILSLNPNGTSVRCVFIPIKG